MPTVDKIYPLQDGRSDWRVNPFIHAKRAYISFIRCLFADGNPLDILFREDIKTTDIVITEGGTINKDLIEKRPGIAVTRDTARLVCRTIASQSNFSMSGMIERKEQLPFSIVTNILSLNDTQAEMIAWYIASRTWLHMDLLSKEGFFNAGTDITISAPGNASSYIEGDLGGFYLVRLIMPVGVLVGGRIDPLNLEKFNKMYLAMRDHNTEENISRVRIDPT